MTIGVSIWTDELVERLLEAVARMVSDPDIHVADIARELGVSHGAVSGKVDRLRRAGHKIPDLSDRIRRPSMPKPHRPRIKPETLATAPLIDDDYVPLQPAPADPPREPGAYTILDLDWGQCRWPVNNGAPFLFCGETTERGSYCAKHHPISVTGRWP